jgi:hypothetical protein
MDKKKVKELIEKTIRFTKVTDDDYIQGNVKSHIINTLQVALKELSRSDWVSVEDGLPPYNENVEVCSKVKPTEVWIDSRDKYIDVGNSFRYNMLYGNIITHWKPIEMLED